jgi:Bax protein
MKFYFRTQLVVGCLVLSLLLQCCEGNKTYTVKTETIQVNSLDQIVLLHDSFVRPVLYTNVKGLEELPFTKAKAKFISAILPAILIAKHELQTSKNKIIRLSDKKSWSEADSTFYQEMKNRYKAKNVRDLIRRLGTLPNSVILAQAAIETGWGESRFFVQASNLFGIWSFDDAESRIAAGQNRNNKTIFLRSYDDMSRSIADYFQVLARHPAYRGLRQARQKSNNPFDLIPHLKNYSERKNWYTTQLKKVIRQNNLTKYDHYRIDPSYLQAE